MDILFLNQDWFREEIEAAGHRVVTCGIRSHMDVVLPHPMLSLEYVLSQCPDDFLPERILFLDESAPLMVTGIEESGIPVLFYSVDIHHHYDCHKHLARNYAKTLFAQKDYLSHFHQVGVNAEWMPLWASRQFEGSEDKEYDALFVGTLDVNLNPDRVRFFDALKTQAPVTTTTGPFWELFPRAEIVMNQTVKGDLNFRVFEAMMSGAVLLTEEAPNGLLELFNADEHLVLYKKGNVADAAEKIEELLADKERCRRIGAAGRKELFAKHLTEHRAERVLGILEDIKPVAGPVSYYAMLPNFDWLYRRLSEMDTQLAHRTMMYIVQLLQKALQAREPLSSELALYVVYSLLEYDRWNTDRDGEKMLAAYGAAYPEHKLFQLAFIWRLLNRGEQQEAERLTRELPSEDVHKTYSDIQNLMMSILQPRSVQ